MNRKRAYGTAGRASDKLQSGGIVRQSRGNGWRKDISFDDAGPAIRTGNWEGWAAIIKGRSSGEQ